MDFRLCLFPSVCIVNLHVVNGFNICRILPYCNCLDTFTLERIIAAIKSMRRWIFYISPPPASSFSLFPSCFVFGRFSNKILQAAKVSLILPFITSVNFSKPPSRSCERASSRSFSLRPLIIMYSKNVATCANATVEIFRFYSLKS